MIDHSIILASCFYRLFAKSVLSNSKHISNSVKCNECLQPWPRSWHKWNLVWRCLLVITLDGSLIRGVHVFRFRRPTCTVLPWERHQSLPHRVRQERQWRKAPVHEVWGPKQVGAVWHHSSHGCSVEGHRQLVCVGVRVHLGRPQAQYLDSEVQCLSQRLPAWFNSL